MSQQDSFFEYITSDRLYACALVFGIVTFIFVCLIYLFLYIKKRRHFINNYIARLIDELIAEAMISSAAEYATVSIDNKITRHLNDPDNRQVVIEQLIVTRKNLKGDAVVNIARLYELLQLKDDSIKKFESHIWHKKAKGIYELYMMHQRKYLPKIYKHTNSKNEYVRMEAQIAIVGFSGFEGLRFLNMLTHPIHAWQQVKILEQLQSFDAIKMEDIEKWLRSDNDYVILFALKLAEIYQQFHVHDIVLQCLENENERIRRQAIKTLGKIAQDTTINALKECYSKEAYENKKEILKQLNNIGTQEDLPFLKEKANEEDELLKLLALRAIAGSTMDINELIMTAAAHHIPADMIGQVKYEYKL